MSAHGRGYRNAGLLAANVGTIATLIPVAMKQLGGIDHLPDPPGAVFDSDGITGSKAAHPLGVPDSLPGLANFGVTLALALEARGNATVRPLLAAKLVLDGGFAAFNMGRQVVSFGKLCSWCTGTAVCAFAMVWAGRTLIAEEAQKLRGMARR